MPLSTELVDSLNALLDALNKCANTGELIRINSCKNAVKNILAKKDRIDTLEKNDYQSVVATKVGMNSFKINNAITNAMKQFMETAAKSQLSVSSSSTQTAFKYTGKIQNYMTLAQHFQNLVSASAIQPASINNSTPLPSNPILSSAHIPLVINLDQAKKAALENIKSSTLITISDFQSLANVIKAHLALCPTDKLDNVVLTGLQGFSGKFQQQGELISETVKTFLTYSIPDYAQEISKELIAKINQAPTKNNKRSTDATSGKGDIIEQTLKKLKQETNKLNTQPGLTKTGSSSSTPINEEIEQPPTFTPNSIF